MVVLLIERGEGVETKHINTSYGPASGTAFVTFDNIKVPVEHTLGPDNGGGLVVILSNFNHERSVVIYSESWAFIYGTTDGPCVVAVSVHSASLLRSA